MLVIHHIEKRETILMTEVYDFSLKLIVDRFLSNYFRIYSCLFTLRTLNINVLFFNCLKNTCESDFIINVEPINR